MRFRLLLLCGLVMTVSVQSTADENADTLGLLAVCHKCHFTEDGKLTRWPDLSGLDETMLIDKLTAHRAQLIEDGTMGRVLDGLSDDDIEKIAQYFAKLTLVEPQ